MSIFTPLNSDYHRLPIIWSYLPSFLQEKERDRGNFLVPSSLDEERYNWYLENAFDLEAIPKLPKAIIDNFMIRCGRPMNLDPSKFLWLWTLTSVEFGLS